jgi:hypothetical protein
MRRVLSIDAPFLISVASNVLVITFFFFRLNNVSNDIDVGAGSYDIDNPKTMFQAWPGKIKNTPTFTPLEVHPDRIDVTHHIVIHNNTTSPSLIQHPTKPWFVIHIGPPSTAASAIQEFLIDNSHSLAQLDNFYFLGGGGLQRNRGSLMSNGEVLPCLFCLVGYLEGLHNESHPDVLHFRSRIQHHRQLGHHLILSAEMLGSWFHNDWDKFETLLYLHDFRLRIILTYRHFVDWIPSWYYQTHHLVARDCDGILPFVEEKLPKMIAQNFEVGGGETFRQHWMIWLLYKQWSSRYGKENVTVLDYHGSSGDFETDWLCHMLPEPTKTCDLLTQSKVESQFLVDANRKGNVPALPKYRQYSPLHVHRIVVHVRTHVIASGVMTVDRSDRFSVKEQNIVLPKIQKMLEHLGVLEEPVSNSTFFECISTETELMLLNISLTFMDLMYRIQGKALSDRERDQAVAKHDIVYEKAKLNGKFCDIRPERVLNHFPDVKVEIEDAVKRFGLTAPASAMQLNKDDRWERYRNTKDTFDTQTEATNYMFFLNQEKGFFSTRRAPPRIIPKLPLPILVVNMPKSGTESIQKYFNCGMGESRSDKAWANHGFSRDFEGKSYEVARCMNNNVNQDRPLLQGCGSWAVYTDDGLMWNDQQGEKKCFYPGVHGLENFAQYYPNATIMHLPRNSTKWAASSRAWGRDLLDRYDRFCLGFEDKARQRSDQEWAQWYEYKYTQGIRDFVKAHPSLTYVESSLDDLDSTARYLENVTGIPASCYGHHHKTSDVIERRKNRNKNGGK